MIPKINSAHGSDTRNILNRAIDLINVHGKTIQDLVAEGQLTEEQYARLITIINDNAKKTYVEKELYKKRDKSQSIMLSDLHTNVKEAMTGGSVPVVGRDSVSTENIIDGSVDIDKLSFTKKSSNLFDPSAGTSGYTPNPWYGGEIENENASITGYIKVEPNTSYYLSVGIQTSFYDVDKEFIEGVSGTSSDQIVVSPENAVYMRTGYSGSGATIMVSESSEAVPFEPFYHVIKKDNLELEDDFLSLPTLISSNGTWVNIDTEKREITIQYPIAILVGGRNYTLDDGTYSYGHITGDSIIVLFDTESKTMEFVERNDVDNVEGDKSILGYMRPSQRLYELNGNYQVDSVLAHSKNQVAHLVGASSSFEVDLENNLINSFFSGGLILCDDKRYYLPDASTPLIENATNIIIYDVSTNEINVISINDFMSGLKYSEYIVGFIRRNTAIDGQDSVTVYGNHQVNKSNVIPFTEDDKALLNTVGRVKEFFLPEVREEYRPSSEHLVVDDQMPHTEILDIYDDLTTNYPDYVKRTVMGQDNFGNDLLMYEFTPPEPQVYKEHKFPKIYYQSAIHGHEKTAATAGALFFKELCEKWKQNEVLEALRWNVSFVVLPMVNPSGFDLNTRKNADEVDLNRNFSDHFNWQGITDTSHRNYPGTEPFSEPETQVIKQVWESNPDITFLFDHHNSGRSRIDGPDHYVFWLGSEVESVKKVGMSLVAQITGWLKKEYTYAHDLNAYIARVTGTNASNTNNEWENVYGGRGFLFETTDTMNNNREDTQDFIMYALGNTIYSVLKNRHWM